MSSSHWLGDCAGVGGVGGDELEQSGNGPQVVVAAANRHRFAEVSGIGLSGDAVAGIGGPPGEGRCLLDGRGRVTEHVRRIGKTRGQPRVEAAQTPQSFLADRGPPQHTGFEHGAQVPFDGCS
ncbi:hypothetical protein HYG77_35065 (plasmid) [Rhodococcus sp. ZPP]|uniref:hypothetical protein n=1 Tax=Rhodococcus sp. ZPP TaxID=2749906 RepID=UPI001AD8585A|nr:hypothetical protein HYG77_35065 [Rhodococcus sp. ZPP]